MRSSCSGKLIERSFWRLTMRERTTLRRPICPTAADPTKPSASLTPDSPSTPNFVPLYGARARAENFLARSDMAKADVERAMRLSPRDPYVGPFRLTLGDSEIYLGHFDAAIDEYHKSIDAGFRTPVVYANLAAAYAQSGKMDDAKAALAEALRLYPRLTVKFYGQAYQPGFLEGLRKAGLPEE